MASFKPYSYFQCPCTDTTIPSYQLDAPPPNALLEEDEEDPDEGQAFDPRAPRANYSLYPLEHLLYCEDCHQIRCPKCVLDEIVTWYCPSCLFEVPSSTVKSEGNKYLHPVFMPVDLANKPPRCTRSCFQCPLCTSPLSTSSVETPPTGLGADIPPSSGPYVLNCGYCNWSSREIGIQLEKPNAAYAQLLKIKNGGGAMITPRERRKERKRELSDLTSGEEEDQGEKTLDLDPEEKLDAESQFSNLKAFYQSQLAESAPVSALGFSGDYGYSSPGALSRIMGLYTGGGSFTDKKSKSKVGVMREASDAIEGLQLVSLSDEEEIINKLRTEGWESTPSTTQREEQVSRKFISDLRPIAYTLRTKRSKRCKSCRHILSKPESKVQTTRFRIRLVALNYIPSITIKPLQPLRTPLLDPMKPVQFLLTFKNPIFDSVKVSIATPAKTPGRFASKVTVLCPSFEVGANTDAWDEALRDTASSSSGSRGEKRRTKAETSEGQNQAEAGKIWEQGRNWTSVVVEVVPASLVLDGPELLKSEELKKDRGVLRVDEDVLEIPVFVRVEWEVEGEKEEGGKTTGGGEKEKRELAYWCVLGVGRIAVV